MKSKGWSGSKHHTAEHHGGEMDGAGELGGPHAGGRTSNRGPGVGRGFTDRGMENPTRDTPPAERDVKLKNPRQEEDNT